MISRWQIISSYVEIFWLESVTFKSNVTRTFLSKIICHEIFDNRKIDKGTGNVLRISLTRNYVLFVSVTGLEPDFAYPLENVTIPQGRDATFTCVVKNLGGYRVSPSSSVSGDHSGSAKARVTILPLTCVRL